MDGRVSAPAGGSSSDEPPAGAGGSSSDDPVLPGPGRLQPACHRGAAAAGCRVGRCCVCGGTRLAVRIGNKVIVGGGMVLFAAVVVWISTASPDTAYSVIAAQMVVLGVRGASRPSIE